MTHRPQMPWTSHQCPELCPNRGCPVHGVLSLCARYCQSTYWASATSSPATSCMQFHKQLKQLVTRAATHPKMAALLEVVLDHFQPQGEPPQPVAATTAQARMSSPTAANAEENAGKPGRVIIFTNRRDSVQSIVEMLRTREPVITARWVVTESAGNHNVPGCTADGSSNPIIYSLVCLLALPDAGC